MGCTLKFYNLNTATRGIDGKIIHSGIKSPGKEVMTNLLGH
jgi:hypothetical protein